jgi:hypothetical protein
MSAPCGLNREQAENLLNNFPCCFIHNGGKNPIGANWQNNPRSASGWNGQGIGVICGQHGDLAIHALDCDTACKTLSEAFLSFLRGYLKGTDEVVLIRVGQSPKSLIPFVIDTQISKSEYTSAKYHPEGETPTKENTNQLEVLGIGNQFVAYHIHPDTQQPYIWSKALQGDYDSLYQVTPDQILRLTPEMLTDIKAAFERLAIECGLVTKPVPKQIQNKPSKSGGYTLDEVLPYLFNHDDAYELWMKVGAAIKAEGGTYEDWLTYSRQSSRHDEAEMPRKWASFTDKPNGSGMGTLAMIAIDNGMPRRSENKTPPPSKPEDWPEIVSLDTAPPERLPVELWPEPLKSYALGASHETETPPELPAMLALGVIAAAAQRLANVEVKSGYCEPINIFAAVALPPAARKSAEFKRATKPLVQWEAKQREKFAEEIKQAESLLKTHRERVKALRQQAAKAKNDDEAETLAQRVAELEAAEPELPTVPRVFTSDITSEHLATMMASNGEALAVMSPEGGIFETMAGRYSNAVPNIDLYLQSHAADAVRVDRGSKPPALLDNPRLTIALAVQPDVLDSLSNKPGFRGRGLLGRFLYVLPPSTLGTRTGSNGRMPVFDEQGLHNRVIELLDAAHSTDEPRTLTLSAEARAEWQSFWAAVEVQLGEFGSFAHMTDWGGKLPGAVARIAALFHLARLGSEGIRQPISAEDMRAAIATGKALASHAVAVYGAMGADPHIEGAKTLVRWIRRHELTEFTAREAYKSHKSRFARASEVDEPLLVLVERGYIADIPQPKGTPGRPSRVYLTNPAVLGVLG